MIISITTGSYTTDEQSQQALHFLETFLPRMRQFPGVRAIYHYASPEQGEETTLFVYTTLSYRLK